jgi:hypothetical protein
MKIVFFFIFQLLLFTSIVNFCNLLIINFLTMSSVLPIPIISNRHRILYKPPYILSLPIIPEQVEPIYEDILFPFPHRIKSSRPLFDINSAILRLRSKFFLCTNLYTNALKEYNALCLRISISKDKLESIRRLTSSRSDSYLSYQKHTLALVFKRNTDYVELCTLHKKCIETEKIYTLISIECVV